MPVFNVAMEIALMLAPFALVLDGLMLMTGILVLRGVAERRERDALILRRMQGH